MVRITLLEKHKYQKKLDTGIDPLKYHTKVDPLSQSHTKLNPLKSHTNIDPLSKKFIKTSPFSKKHPLGTIGRIRRR